MAGLYNVLLSFLLLQMSIINSSDAQQCVMNNTQSLYNYYSSNETECANLSRTGILCGQCNNNNNHSLWLGPNNICAECHNANLALIIPFAAAGLALIILLIGLNLTVSVGTINGLIFYANVIQINEKFFYPNGSIPFSTQFISWINLDFGINTCFFFSLDQYTKTWLQFIFPLYLFILMIIVIILCKLIPRLAEYIGNIVYPTLATVILLSYTKITRNIAVILQFVPYSNIVTNTSNETNTIYITDITNDTTIGWGPDPNLKYFHWPHSILGAFAILVLLAFTLPYIVSLLVYPFCYQRCLVKYKCFRYFYNYFIVTYNSPYKQKFRCWTAILLIARLVLIICSVSISNNDVNISITTAIVVFLMGMFAAAKGVYNKEMLDYIECWFLFNLLILLSFVRVSCWFTLVSTLVTFLTFCGIIIYHFVLKLAAHCCKSKYSPPIHTIQGEVISVTSSNNTSLMSSLVEDATVVIDHRNENLPTVVVERFKKRDSLILNSSRDTDINYVTFDESDENRLAHSY
jgi:hypothetical protein